MLHSANSLDRSKCFVQQCASSQNFDYKRACRRVPDAAGCGGSSAARLTGAGEDCGCQPQRYVKNFSGGNRRCGVATGTARSAPEQLVENVAGNGVGRGFADLEAVGQLE